jgi:hypothetical protein
MTGPARDRDAGGRARNARPRDTSGRPLPRDAVGADRVADDAPLTATQSLAEAERLLVADLPFAAHDILEAQWKTRRDAGAADAPAWQGLAQIAVGLTHLQRGNRVGAARLLERGAGNLGSGALAAWAIGLARAIECGNDQVVESVLEERPNFLTHL